MFYTCTRWSFDKRAHLCIDFGSEQFEFQARRQNERARKIVEILNQLEKGVRKSLFWQKNAQLNFLLGYVMKKFKFYSMKNTSQGPMKTTA